MPHELSNKDAMDSVIQVLQQLRELGFAITGGLSISHPKQFNRGTVLRFDSPDGKFSQLRFTPAVASTPATDAFISPNPTSGSLNAIERTTIASATIGADGIIHDGSVCVGCSGTSFIRKGSCLYCVNCGESLGGCS